MLSSWVVIGLVFNSHGEDRDRPSVRAGNALGVLYITIFFKTCINVLVKMMSTLAKNVLKGSKLYAWIEENRQNTFLEDNPLVASSDLPPPEWAAHLEDAVLEIRHLRTTWHSFSLYTAIVTWEMVNCTITSLLMYSTWEADSFSSYFGSINSNPVHVLTLSSLAITCLELYDQFGLPLQIMPGPKSSLPRKVVSGFLYLTLLPYFPPYVLWKAAREIKVTMPFTEDTESGSERYRRVYIVDKDGRPPPMWLIGMFTICPIWAHLLLAFPSLMCGCGLFFMIVISIFVYTALMFYFIYFNVFCLHLIHDRYMERQGEEALARHREQQKIEAVKLASKCYLEENIPILVVMLSMVVPVILLAMVPFKSSYFSDLGGGYNHIKDLFDVNFEWSFPALLDLPDIPTTLTFFLACLQLVLQNLRKLSVPDLRGVPASPRPADLTPHLPSPLTSDLPSP